MGVEPVQAAAEQLTWTALLNIANTFLVVMVGFLLREAWKTIHARMDQLEDQHGDMRERVASLEAAGSWQRRRFTDKHKGDNHE